MSAIHANEFFPVAPWKNGCIDRGSFSRGGRCCAPLETRHFPHLYGCPKINEFICMVCVCVEHSTAAGLAEYENSTRQRLHKAPARPVLRAGVGDAEGPRKSHPLSTTKSFGASNQPARKAPSPAAETLALALDCAVQFAFADLGKAIHVGSQPPQGQSSFSCCWRARLSPGRTSCRSLE